MMAAEKVGLFGVLGWSLYQSVDGWMVVHTEVGRPVASLNDSGPLAICIAILKAKSVKP